MPLILSTSLPSTRDITARVFPDSFPVYSALPSSAATTGTRLDILPAIIETDAGLAQNASPEDIAEAAAAMDGINRIILDLATAQGALDDGEITADEVEAINAAIRGDADLLAEVELLHGSDAAGAESGLHAAVNDGGSVVLFGRGAINRTMDALGHIGFEIVDGQFTDQSGRPGAEVSAVADTLTYFLGDLSTTGTGLDLIVDTALIDDGLARGTSASDIVEGARAADALNRIILEAIEATGAGDDQRITTEEVVAINGYIRTTPGLLDEFTILHGDDENGEETGFHLIQGDGATTQFGAVNLINNTADGLYHIGFEIDAATQRVANEDGDLNASTGELATDLNKLLYGVDVIYGTSVDDLLVGSDAAEEFFGEAGRDAIVTGAGDDVASGGTGNDFLRGDLGNDTLMGDAGRDLLFGDDGADIITGGADQDIINAGFDDDADVLVFAPGDTGSDAGTIDVVSNFDAAGEDLIDLSAFGGLTFVEGAFTGLGQVSYQNGFVLINTAEGGAAVGTEADAAILVQATEALGAEDFIL